jgi:hypothetical protein
MYVFGENPFPILRCLLVFLPVNAHSKCIRCDCVEQVLTRASPRLDGTE